LNIRGTLNKFQDYNPNTVTVNHTILTVMLLFNLVSLQFNTAFPLFYKLAESCGIEVFVGRW